MIGGGGPRIDVDQSRGQVKHFFATQRHFQLEFNQL